VCEEIRTSKMLRDYANKKGREGNGKSRMSLTLNVG